jgi:hypothetical protein
MAAAQHGEAAAKDTRCGVPATDVTPSEPKVSDWRGGRAAAGTSIDFGSWLFSGGPAPGAAGGRGDDLARAQRTKRSATQWSAAPCASSGPVRRAGPSVAVTRRTPGPAIPATGRAAFVMTAGAAGLAVLRKGWKPDRVGLALDRHAPAPRGRPSRLRDAGPVHRSSGLHPMREPSRARRRRAWPWPVRTQRERPSVLTPIDNRCVPAARRIRAVANLLSWCRGEKVVQEQVCASDFVARVAIVAASRRLGPAWAQRRGHRNAAEYTRVVYLPECPSAHCSCSWSRSGPIRMGAATLRARPGRV